MHLKSRNTLWMVDITSNTAVSGYIRSLIFLPPCKPSDTVCVCALTYLDSSSHDKKTITTIFLVMRFCAGTRGYETHIQTSHDMTHPTKQRLQICA